MSDEFDWNNDPDVVQFEQPSIAVYTNAKGEIVIRKERTWDEDTYIILGREKVVRICNAICQTAGIGIVYGAPGPALPAPKDPTAAERQRKRRRNLRNGVTHCDSHAGVTPFDRDIPNIEGDFFQRAHTS